MLTKTKFKILLENRLRKIFDNEDEIRYLSQEIHDKVIDVTDGIAGRNNENSKNLFSEKDIVLIAYAQHISKNGKSKLACLKDFVDKYLREAINSIHLLPFYPSNGDGGFSVCDYYEVDPEFGSWEDIESFNYKLMFDAVFNHISSKSAWFQAYLNNEEKYQNYFINFKDEELDDSLKEKLAKVIRPRANPLLTSYIKKNGEKVNTWTTFSEDQIDLNFAEAEVLLELVEILIFYITEGAKLIRFDAVPFMWKEIGTNCSNLRKTHEIIKLFREIVSEIDPNCLIIAEANIPHQENINYFGNGFDESHMIYNFSLAPLIVYANYKSSARYLFDWSSHIELPSEETTFFNVTATHDGIGVRPLKGIIKEEEIEDLCQEALKKGGEISYKTKLNAAGETIKSPYELNITWTSMLLDEDLDLITNTRKIVSSHLAVAAFTGIPAMYLNNFLASTNSYRTYEKSNIKRDLNRELYHLDEIEKDLSENTLRQSVFKSLTEALKIRSKEKAFHPLSVKRDFHISDKIWSFLRLNSNKYERIMVLYNVSKEDIDIEIHNLINYAHINEIVQFYDLLSDFKTDVNTKNISLKAYQTMWLKYY